MTINNAIGHVCCLAQNESYFFSSGFNKGLFRTDKNSILWQDVSSGLNALDVRSLAFSGDQQRLFAGSGAKGLFFIESNEIESGNWQHSAVPIQRIDEIQNIYTSTNNVVYFSIFQGYLFKSYDNGYNFQCIYNNNEWGYGRYFFVDPSDDNKIIFLRGDKILLSRNGGSSWSTNSCDGLCFKSGAFNPFDTNVVLIGSTRIGPHGDVLTDHAFLYRSIDGGTSWNKVPFVFGDVISNIHFDKINQNIVYLCAWDGANEGIFKSSDSGNTWEKITSESAYSFIINPLNSKELLTVGGNGFSILNTETKNNSFYNTGFIETNMPLQFIISDPRNPNIIYVSSNLAGIWKLDLNELN